MPRPTTSPARSACPKLVPRPANLQALYKAFWECDASLAEINPLILTGDGRVIALDAKMNFDSNALFRHPDIVALRDLDEEDPAEIEASKFDLSYISLDGNIGCLVNGAGLAMATMDTIKLYGGSPANFLDVGGGATTEKVTEAFKIMLRNPGLKAILVNIFGGIMKCDTIAKGVVAAAQAGQLVGAAGGAHEGHERGTRQEDPRRLRPADHLRQHGRHGVDAAAKVVRRRGKGSFPAPDQGPCRILINKDTRVITQGITGKTGQFHTTMCRDVRQRQELLRRRREPEEGRRGLRGHPDLRVTSRTPRKDRRQRVRDLRAAALRRRRHLGGGRGPPRPRHLHHRGHPGARHDPNPRPHAEGPQDACCSGRTAPASSRPTRSRSASCRATSTARAASASCRAPAR
jgi:hypothetical protein